MSIVVRAESQEPNLIADGIYPATLTNIKQFNNAYGPRLGFEFTLNGSGGGAIVMRSTTPNLTEKSKLTEMISGLMGRELNPADMACGIDVEALIGADCKVLVKQSRSKTGKIYSNVEQVLKA